MYNIDGTDFNFKDLTIEEEEKVDKIISKNKSATGVNFTTADVISLFTIILEPAEKSSKANNVKFTRCKAKTRNKILMDFFSILIKERIDLINYFGNLQQNAKERNQNIAP